MVDKCELPKRMKKFADEALQANSDSAKANEEWIKAWSSMMEKWGMHNIGDKKADIELRKRIHHQAEKMKDVLWQEYLWSQYREELFHPGSKWQYERYCGNDKEA